MTHLERKIKRDEKQITFLKKRVKRWKKEEKAEAKAKRRALER